MSLADAIMYAAAHKPRSAFDSSRKALQRLTPLEREEARRLHAGGHLWSIKQLAKRYEVKPGTIKRELGL